MDSHDQAHYGHQSPQGYYHPQPSHPSSQSSPPSMLFGDVRAPTYPTTTTQPMSTQADTFMANIEEQGHSTQHGSWPAAEVPAQLDELEPLLDINKFYPAFHHQSSSPSPVPRTHIYTTSPHPYQHQHQHSHSHQHPHSHLHMNQHLSPTDIPSISTHNLHYSPTTPALSAGPSTPSYCFSQGLSPTSAGYPSPDNLRTPITPYSSSSSRLDLVAVGHPSANASPASSIGANLLWPLVTKPEGRPRSLSDSRVPPPIPTGCGQMVPQKRYRPHTTSDRRRYVEEVELEPPIEFKTLRPERDAFALADAIAGKFATLAHRDDPMFNERGPSISVRINWPGYNSWSRQIPTRDFRNPPGPITRAKLAKNVAKSVSRFITEMTGKQMEEDADPAWKVGPAPRFIHLNQLALVRLEHVSKGSWQAQLCLVSPTQQL